MIPFFLRESRRFSLKHVLIFVLSRLNTPKYISITISILFKLCVILSKMETSKELYIVFIVLKDILTVNTTRHYVVIPTVQLIARRDGYAAA